ncbi:MAG TPA: hypothetical protein VFW11_16280 [Cyclobacteriaceae bacterium]|nr:hypothetical protein [Cyclobacteriaceae bacterium]
MSLLRSSYFFLLLTALFSCKQNDIAGEKVFYDIDSLLTVQEKYLAESKPILFKRANLGDQLDSIKVSGLDTTAWSTEFEIFRQLDLNKKSVNKENYTIRKNIRDPYSNLLICEYTAKSDLPVKRVKIYYQQRLTNPRRIEGDFSEQNGLYKSTRYMLMELNNIHNKTLVTRYTITGGQKMILGDSVEFEITGIVTH